MTEEEIRDHFDVEDNQPLDFFEPQDVFNEGILGITEDHKHVVYGYYTLAAALAESFEKDWNKENHSEDEEKPDFYDEAFDWIDTNTIQYMTYMNKETCPIMIYEVPK